MRTRRVGLVLVPAVLGFLLSCSEKKEGPAGPGSEHPPAVKVWYVDASATGTGDGSSWESALTHPQYAVDSARAGEQVWVAMGTYTSLSPSDSTASVLVLKKGVEVYGGFQGIETSIDQRDPVGYQTVLDGESKHNHVVVAADSCVLDGFTVRRGFAGGYPLDSLFTGSGGGMVMAEIRGIVVRNCRFEQCTATEGGAIVAYISSGSIEKCYFAGNVGYAGGGAVFLYVSETVHIDSCTFSWNTSFDDGGAVLIDCGLASVSTPTIQNSLFENNSAYKEGGAVLVSSTWYTMGVAISGCTFRANQAQSGGAVYSTGRSRVKVESCLFENNNASAGGAYYMDSGAYDEIRHCEFVGNQVDWSGAAVYCGGGGDHVLTPRLFDCLIRSNTAAIKGGGIYKTGLELEVINCTLTSNNSNLGGGIAVDTRHINIVSSIIWGNIAGYNGNEIYTAPSVPIDSVTVTNSDIGQVGWEGSNGNIRRDPDWVQGPRGDYYLMQISAGQSKDSPCVDSGHDTSENLGLIHRTTRTDGGMDVGRVDMGYHYEP